MSKPAFFEPIYGQTGFDLSTERPSCLYWRAPRSARKSKTAPLYVHVLEQFWLPVTLFIPLFGEGVAISQALVYLESTHLLI